MNADVLPSGEPESAPAPVWPTLSFIALCLCWLLALALPCLRQTDVMRFAEDAVLALMAAVILVAVHTAWVAGETLTAALFAGAELLYCGAY